MSQLTRSGVRAALSHRRTAKALSIGSAEDVHFAIDTIRNVFWFFVLGFIALGIQSYVRWLEAHGASFVLIALFTTAELALIFADVGWLLSRLTVSTYKFALRAKAEIADARASASH
jgi:hypothetical protein